jgi:CRP/FNR family transcriptional regulator, anaerobic regulatory protein
VPKYLYFLASGYMRLFYYNNDGDEITTYLSVENSFIASFLSLIHQKPAKENVECVTDCEIIRILRTDLLQLIDESDNFKKFSLTIFEHAIASTEMRANDLATLNAEQRYKKIISQYPNILQHVPIQYIASFLGIKPESLSRIRKQLANVK